MAKKFELKEQPIFDNEELYTSFMDWYKRVAEERTALDNTVANEPDGFERRAALYNEFYRKIGFISNDLFNDFANVHSVPDKLSNRDWVEAEIQI